MTDEETNFVQRIDATDNICYVNTAWCRFAEENGCPDLPQQVIGTPLWNWIAGKETKHILRQLLAKVRSTQSSIELPFRCDSPAIRRFLRLQIQPPARLTGPSFAPGLSRKNSILCPFPSLTRMPSTTTTSSCTCARGVRASELVATGGLGWSKPSMSYGSSTRHSCRGSATACAPNAWKPSRRVWGSQTDIWRSYN